MKTAEPIFKEGVLERVLGPTQKQHATVQSKRDTIALAHGGLAPTGSVEAAGERNPSVEQNQDMSIGQISSSVCGLHDSMSELKSAFTALRIELNGSGIEGTNNNLEMVSTVLKELKSKSQEIEKLQLENEALKLRNKYAEVQGVPQPGCSATLPEVQSPGLLLPDNKKRPWADTFPNGRTQPIADSFDDDDNDEVLPDNYSPSQAASQTMRIPLREPGLITPLTDEPPDVRLPPDSSKPSIEPQPNQQSPNYQTGVMQPVVVKRQRLNQQIDSTATDKSSERRKSTRPRRSFSRTPRPDTSHTLQQATQSEQNSNASGDRGRTVPSDAANANGQRGSNSSQKTRRGRSRARSISQADQQQAEQESDKPTEKDSAAQTAKSTESGPPPPDTRDTPEKENSQSIPEHNTRKGVQTREARRSQVASRDHLARLAMQREEAMGD